MSISKLFRGMGALSLLVSASSFLLTTWGEQSDVVRYGIILAHIGLLFCASLFSVKALKDARTGRVILWTSAAIIPVASIVPSGENWTSAMRPPNSDCSLYRIVPSLMFQTIAS